MYFPYLRGRQFELIALRELVENSLLSDKIIPIVEPVKMSSTLVKTIQVYQDADKKLALIFNPQVGGFMSELKKDKNKHLKDKLNELINLENIIYVHHLSKNSKKSISKISKMRQIKDIMVICENKDYIPVYQEIFHANKPKYNLIPDESVFRRRIRHNRVMLDDKFNKQRRNTDYLKIEDEPFSDDHIYYDEDGYVGFSDYSLIGNEYNETGFAPYAVAIHIVYFDEDNSLRIRHFVSDTNDDIADPAGKFAEAVNKLAKWNKNQNLDTFGINAFIKMSEDEIYPGLGTVKKLSIMHHIELIGRFLDGKL